MINLNDKIELRLFEALLGHVSDDKILVFNLHGLMNVVARLVGIMH